MSRHAIYIIAMIAKADRVFMQVAVSAAQMEAFRRAAAVSGIEQVATWARSRLIEAATKELAAIGERPTFLPPRPAAERGDF